MANHLTTAINDDDAYETDELVPLQNNVIRRNKVPKSTCIITVSSSFSSLHTYM